MRIVSLLASGTELVDALGAGDQLVGRSHECDHPSWVSRLPVMSRPTFDTEGGSAEIDLRVREKLRAGEPLYEVDEEALAALASDVVITQTHCEVCAVGPQALGRPPARRKVATFRGGTLEGVLGDFLAIARLIDREQAGQRLVERLRADMGAWRARTAGLARPRVVCLEWIGPPFAMGNWGPELIALAGGQCVLGQPGAHSRAICWREVLDAQPDVLVVAPCGFGLPRALAEMPILAAGPGWEDLPAVRSGRVYAADGNLYFNRSGPSLFATVDRLAEMFHPDRFGRHHEGVDYKRYPAADEA